MAIQAYLLRDIAILQVVRGPGPFLMLMLLRR